MGIGNVGRRKQICFQKMGGSSIVVRKLVGKGAGQGARLFSYKSVSSSGRAASRCMHTVTCQQ